MFAKSCLEFEVFSELTKQMNSDCTCMPTFAYESNQNFKCKSRELKTSYKNKLFGDQLLGCGQGNCRTRRHDAFCDVIFNALLVDNVNCRKVQRCNSNYNMRPGDVYHPDFEQGLPTYFDLTVRNSLQPFCIAQTAQHAGVAAEAGEKEKDCRHEGLVTVTAKGVFHLLAVESLDLWSHTT